MENLRDFYDQLNEAERQLSAEVAADRVGLLMRIAINELDLDFEGFHRGTPSNEADQERSYIIRIGVVRILKLAMEAHRDFEAPAIIIQRDLRYSGPLMERSQKSSDAKSRAGPNLALTGNDTLTALS
jgi:hypothetical protein